MRKSKTPLARCVRNDGFEVSLEKRKLYQIVPDRVAEAEHFLRVIDESGEPYVYPATFFVVDGDDRIERLAEACLKLDPAEESAMADEGIRDLAKIRKPTRAKQSTSRRR